MGVAALDAYIHMLILERLAQVRRSADIPKLLRGVGIRFEELAEVADKSMYECDARGDNEGGFPNPKQEEKR